MFLRFLASAFLAPFTLATVATSMAQDADPPNVVLMLVDDAALMDFGVYGGEARTPNIDMLAAEGAMFTQYRTSPLCSPSRAMLLTGMDNHLTGIATIPEVLPKEHEGQPGYAMSLEPGVLTLADHLRPQGYQTFMTGKWHMGSGKGDLPSDHGFDRSFALDASGADNWEDKSYMPYYHDAPWYEDGKAAALPDDFYSSKFIVEKMISYLDDASADEPFFAFLGFQAIHIPVQAPPEFTANYDGVYDQGWHALREARHQTAMTLGLIPEGAPLAPMPEGSRNWQDLSDDERAVYTARMQVNAGMLEAMDVHIGRLIDYLKQVGEYDDTIFIITSDNGPEHNRGDEDSRLAFWMRLNGYHIDLEGVGERGSWGFIGPEWANAAASPGALYKFYMAEGGIRAPLIMSGPGIAPQRVDAMSLVSDVAPTVLDLTGTDETAGAEQAMTGRSLLPVLAGAQTQVYGADDPIGMEVSGNSALYKGDYKITRHMPPTGDGMWRLYDMANDPGETRDLSATLPDKKAELLADYEAYAARVGVLEMPDGYDSLQQIEANTRAKLTKRYGWMVIVAGLIFLALLYGLWRVIRHFFIKPRSA
ncbi:MAG: arylsulfatase [Hyphomonadaceae bacterium]|nr:arylsulfatase [Hyphomonadaceae bacterium]